LVGGLDVNSVLNESYFLALVRTPEKVRQRIEMGDDFMREVLQEGKYSMKPIKDKFNG